MIAWIKSLIERRQRIRSKWKVVRMIQKFMKDNWSRPTRFSYIGERLEERIWVIGDWTLTHSRMIRADLIELTHGETEMASWVDQSHAWNGMLGLNDIMIRTNHLQVEKAIAQFQQ